MENFCRDCEHILGEEPYTPWPTCRAVPSFSYNILGPSDDLSYQTCEEVRGKGSPYCKLFKEKLEEPKSFWDKIKDYLKRCQY